MAKLKQKIFRRSVKEAVDMEDPGDSEVPSSEQQLTCGWCNKQMFCLIRHCNAKHWGKFPYSCSLCEKNFASQAIVTHVNASHKQHVTNICCYKCNLCQGTFLKWSELDEHFRLVHPDPHIHPNKQTVDVQIKNEDAITCVWCNEQFLQHAALKKHIRRKHDGRYPFQCNECGKSYASRYITLHARVTHRRSDHSKSIYGCKVCTASFTNWTTLLGHFYTKHKNDKAQRIYPCKTCKKRFVRHKSYVNHSQLCKQMASSSPCVLKVKKQRVFRCALTYCRETFVLKSKYKKHLQDHMTSALASETPIFSVDITKSTEKSQKFEELNVMTEGFSKATGKTDSAKKQSLKMKPSLAEILKRRSYKIKSSTQRRKRQGKKLNNAENERNSNIDICISAVIAGCNVENTSS